MKTKIVALTIALLPTLAGARDLRPGTLELSGGTDLGFGSATTEVNGVEQFDTSVVSLNADALYYIVNNFGLGLGVSYDRQKEEDSFGGDTFEQSTTVIGPQAKFNLPLAPQASLMLTGAVGRMALKQDDGFDTNEADGWAFLLGGGVRFFPADFVSLDALLSYTNAGVEDDFGNEIDVSGWDVGVGVSIYFGGR